MQFIFDKHELKKQYQYIPKIYFYPKEQISSIAIKNNTIYMYSKIEEMLIIQLFALNGQQKVTKKFHLELREIYFMNQSNEFVIFDCGLIEIWKIDYKYNFVKFKTILNDEKELVASLVISQNDDLMVTSMWNGALLFWKKIFDWECYLKLQDKWGDLVLLKLNQKGTYLITINGDGLIFLFSSNLLDKENEWKFKEKINEKHQTFCFIDDSHFACVSFEQNVVTIYKISAELKKYKSINLSGKIESNYSLIEYQKQKKVLLVQKDNRLFLIHKTRSWRYILQQKKIKFSSEELLMTISQNGDFLLINSTFDELDICRKIELRRFVGCWKD